MIYRGEVKVAIAIVKHYAFFAMAHAIRPLIKNIFDESKITNSYAAAKTVKRFVV